MGKKKAALSRQLADIDIRLLNVFKAVVDFGGFSAAEIPLNLANSTISNYIADLENRLDMHLCDRGRAGFKLTEHGLVVYNATVELMAALEQFRATINQSHHRLLGYLHIAFAEHMLSVHDSCMITALQAFTEMAPDVEVKISTMSSDEVTTAVQNKNVDIGVTVLSERFNEFESLALFSEEMLVYCAQGHPLFNQEEISPQELQHYHFVESPRLMRGREPHSDMELWNKTAIAHHQEARATLILSGAYLGILPKHIVSNWGLNNKMKPLFIERYGYQNPFKAVRLKKGTNELITDVFFQCLKSAISR
ncbi:LysR family transcriptional regulator [Colwellia sp. 1_MG-2023]|uniref:LysR family transcriptional regulator n=1 Tax=Colwellia sp. 1_MG-2023 TaxID=3062649 RepID=UPI0026E400DA|nr:LysR family transcriptional regulator [Colwellia sp. 1_MG-2023]MDO6446149.1 LysR family transcriptional regulator [Colwellia sp. 1_MG-2023]